MRRVPGHALLNRTDRVPRHAHARVSACTECRASQELHEAGKFREFGLSNYPAWKVVDVWHRCRELNIPPPTAWQGMYNIITRGVEGELILGGRKVVIFKSWSYF